MAVIYGTAGADVSLSGTSNDDEIYGGPSTDPASDSGDDVLTGGLGNDLLAGFGGNDIYNYSAGDGFDIIREEIAGGMDVLQFAAGVSAADLRFERQLAGVDGDLFIHFGGEFITIEDQYTDQQIVSPRLETVRFDDGSTIDLTTLSLWDGTGASEILWGASQDDTIRGFAGDDFLYGFDGADMMLGGDGGDRLEGGAGGDLLTGGSGIDRLIGGDGGDSYFHEAGDGEDVIQEESGAAGTDSLHFGAGLAAADLRLTREATAIAGDLFIHADGETIRVEDQYTGLQGLDVRLEAVHLDDGTIIDLTGPAAFTGTASGETLWGANTEDTVTGLGGDDFLFGYDGNDSLNGGSGEDALDGGAGDDTYAYAVGDGADTISEAASGGADTLVLSADFIAADIRLMREATATQGDLFIFLGGEMLRVFDQYSGQQGINARLEKIRLSDSSEISLTEISAFTGTAAADTLWGTVLGETLYGEAGDDVIYGYNGADTLNGGAGADFLEGSFGADILRGGMGNDTLIGGAANDVYAWEAGDGEDIIDETGGTGAIDILDLGPGLTHGDLRFFREAAIADGALEIHIDGAKQTVLAQYTDQENTAPMLERIRFDNGQIIDLTSLSIFTGTAAGETLWGSGQDDTLKGLEGIDFLFGFSGADSLDGGAGNDDLSGGTGGDGYLYAAGDGNDVIREESGIAGIDRLRLSSDFAPDDIRFSRELTVSGGDLYIHAGGNFITVPDQYADQETADPRLEQVVFDDGTIVDLTTLSDWTGTAFQEILWGTGQDDRLDGLAGNDFMFGFVGDDRLIGGQGGDSLDGGAGTDIASYETAGARVLVDMLNLAAATGDAAGDGYTSIEGLAGSAFNDQLRGNNAANILEGLGFSDRLYGRAGDDNLDGGAGADALYGNQGADQMTGGAGADRFIYFAAVDSRSGTSDRITDFTPGSDRIEISRLDADLGTGGNQLFQFIGSAAFSGTAGELRAEQQAGTGRTVISADQTGDMIADFVIELDGLLTLSAADFML